MVRKSKGRRRGTRHKMKIKKKPTITRFLQEFKQGDKVNISICPSSKGAPYHRFLGKTGVVVDKRGNAYIVTTKDGRKEKTIIVKPEHLKLVK